MKKKLTGYPHIDKPWEDGQSYFKRNPIIPDTSITTLFRALSQLYKDKNAVNCLDLTATYDQLISDSITISRALQELNVKKGDIIAVSMPNLYQAVAVFFACNRIGAVTTFLNSHAQKDEITNYLNEFESPIFINYSASIEDNMHIKYSTNVRYIITLDKKKINSLDIYDNYHVTSCKDYMIDFGSLGSIAAFKKNIHAGLGRKKDDAMILFTSGSTGNPKSVLLTNENILAAEIYAKNTSHTENITGPKTLTCVPFSYPYGFVTSALTTLLWGKESILAPNISKDTISYYYSKKPNIIFGSPALLDLTMNNIPENQDLSFVSHFISGGDFLTPEHAKRGNDFFSKHGAFDVEIGNGCGNAETVSIGSTPVGVPLKPATAGKILVGTTAMIVDPDTMEEKKCGEEGMLCLSGKLVFKEYYHNPDLTQDVKFEKNGKIFYKTGTMGIIDTDGYFTVTARQSRFYIMSSLNKVYCDNVQNIISAYNFIKDCAVVKVPDDELLFVNKAYIVLSDGIEPTEETKKTLFELFKNPTINAAGKKVQLKDYEIPTYITFVNELPRKPGTEKIDYPLLEKQALEEYNLERGMTRVLKITKKSDSYC